MLLYYSRFILKDDYAINRVVYFRSEYYFFLPEKERYSGILADICFLPLPWVVVIVNQKIRKGLLNWKSPKPSISAVTVMTRNPRSTMLTYP